MTTEKQLEESMKAAEADAQGRAAAKKEQTPANESVPGHAEVDPHNSGCYSKKKKALAEAKEAAALAEAEKAKTARTKAKAEKTRAEAKRAKKAAEAKSLEEEKVLAEAVKKAKEEQAQVEKKKASEANEVEKAEEKKAFSEAKEAEARASAKKAKKAKKAELAKMAAEEVPVAEHLAAEQSDPVPEQPVAVQPVAVQLADKKRPGVIAKLLTGTLPLELGEFVGALTVALEKDLVPQPAPQLEPNKHEEKPSRKGNRKESGAVPSTSLPALGAQMYVMFEGRTLLLPWIKDETVDALSRRIEDKEGVCVRRIQVEGHAMQEGEAPHGVAPGGQVQALLGGLPGGTRGGPSSAGRGSTTPAEALHLILCFLPDELWRNAREYDLVFKSEAKLHRRDGTRFKAVLLLKGNGCKDEWIIAFLKRRLRHDDGRWQKRVEHLGSILADCDGGKYDAVWFYHCVRDNDLKYLNGKVALDKAAPSPLARLLNAWNAEIWRVWCVDGRWLKHAEQHAFFKPPAPEV